MTNKINVGKNAKITVRYDVRPENYTKEKEREIQTLTAKKYGISKSSVNVEVNFIKDNINSGDCLKTDEIKNIHDPKHQENLMKRYLDVNRIEGYDWNKILEIDSMVNSQINYDKYDKGKKYSINYVRFSNFLSYGKDNYLDFSSLKGLVLLNGEPANESGKSTLAYDVTHFLLFGKTNSDKASTNAQLFNNYLPNENQITVEGEIVINGERYFIKRTITRPEKSKKDKVTATQKVEYYHIVNDDTKEELVDFENAQEASTTKTNKVIKEALGNEADFDMIVSAHAKDLDAIISMKDAERSRTINKWCGLEVLEDKDKIAADLWNKKLSKGRLCDLRNVSDLELDTEDRKTKIEQIDGEVSSNNKNIENNKAEIIKKNQEKDNLLTSKEKIDTNLPTDVDVQTLKAEIEGIVEEGKRLKAQKEAMESEINGMPTMEFDANEFEKTTTEKDYCIGEIAKIKSDISHKKEMAEALKKSEYCPTCGHKLDNVDNTDKINACLEEINKLIDDGKKLNERKEKAVATLASLEDARKNNYEKNRKELALSSINIKIGNTREQYKDKTQLYNSLIANINAIKKNNEIDAKINVVNESIRSFENANAEFERKNSLLLNDKTTHERIISENAGNIVKIKEELAFEKNYKLYREMIGRDGITKLILKESLPIIDSEVNRILGDAADFKFESVINDKKDIDFYIVRDDVRTKLSAASGLERTQTALVLRVVLGKMSNLSRPPFIILDEILGTVAKENYDKMHAIYDRIVTEYDFILHITHLDLQDWHTGGVITVQKVNNISSIKN